MRKELERMLIRDGAVDLIAAIEAQRLLRLCLEKEPVDIKPLEKAEGIVTQDLIPKYYSSKVHSGWGSIFKN